MNIPASKLDMDMGFWINNLHYIWLPDEDLDFRLSQRVYILPDNCIIASEGELYEYQEEVNLCNSDSPQVQIAKNLLQFITMQNAIKKYKGAQVKTNGKVVGRVGELLGLWLLEQNSFGRVFESLYPKFVKGKKGESYIEGIHLDTEEGPENFIYLDIQLPRRKHRNCIPFKLIPKPQGYYLINYKEDIPKCKLTKFGKITSIVNDLKKVNSQKPKIKRQFLPFVVNMIPSFPRLKYKSFEDNIHFNKHHGQRKLLNSEIEFLTDFTIPTKEYVVVYAGAADGRHIPLLAELFPNCRFVLYDPAPFAINPTPRIMIRNKLFLEEDAISFIGTENLLFISDIRSVPPKDLPEGVYEAEFEKHVRFDLGLQKMWVQHMRAPSMLKFRLPYEKGQMEYFAGNIVIQDWAPVHSTESRLIVTDFDTMVTYDQQTYEEQFYYFNAVYRPSQFYDKDLIFGQNYDVYREAWTWRRYLEKYLNVKGGHPYENIFRMMEISDYFLDRKEQYVTRNLK